MYLQFLSNTRWFNGSVYILGITVGYLCPDEAGRRVETVDKRGRTVVDELAVDVVLDMNEWWRHTGWIIFDNSLRLPSNVVYAYCPTLNN